jgi:predicted esterase
MPGWTDIFYLMKEGKEDAAGFEAASERIWKIIEGEKARGIPIANIAVGGFSQGGALALHVALRSSEALGACVALSSWIPLSADYPAALGSAARQIPVFQGHGDSDQIVAHSWGHSSHLALKEWGFESTKFETYKNMPHSACDKELDAVGEFLRKQLKIDSSS